MRAEVLQESAVSVRVGADPKTSPVFWMASSHWWQWETRVVMNCTQSATDLSLTRELACT